MPVRCKSDHSAGFVISRMVRPGKMTPKSLTTSKKKKKKV